MFSPRRHAWPSGEASPVFFIHVVGLAEDRQDKIQDSQDLDECEFPTRRGADKSSGETMHPSLELARRASWDHRASRLNSIGSRECGFQRCCRFSRVQTPPLEHLIAVYNGMRLVVSGRGLSLCLGQDTTEATVRDDVLHGWWAYSGVMTRACSVRDRGSCPVRTEAKSCAQTGRRGR